MQKDKNIKEVQDEERPLPQRISRVKPRVLSNVQLIPLRMEKHPVEDRSRTLDREIGKDSNIERSESGRRREDNGTWRKVDGGRRSRRGIGRENYHLSTPGNNTQ